ncbi:helix-turn-helix domain-containing protein [Pseudohongiella sp. SYSU M77423]|uniref:TetR/AcrR family transcriptional regulator n=1 Tax=Pseudohongiella sp. SYSU M77423 TaxID=3042312 RepID=UPI0024816035|nr:TetR/AcrR family transcriptional regulator [Pseudohongiella sp. SYSU M77423]MDH7943435.1 helix-turn-helix domain-containing protein [Pseudohongiella sp. SYSU M77423]
MTAPAMDQREIDIVDAAMRVVLRYGMARTTMSDVAQEAGISRQTLYAIFSSKDELLRAIIRHLANRTVAEIEAEFARTSDLGERLDAVIWQIAGRSFELLRASPDADDIVSGFNAACKEELERNTARYRTLIEAMLQPYSERISGTGMSVPALADFIQKSTLTLKHEAADMAHLKTLAGSLKTLVLQVARPAN